MASLNPAQHRLLKRHVERALETLNEADRLLRGAVSQQVQRCVREVEAVLDDVELEESRMVRFRIDELPVALVPYLDNPFVQSIVFNRFCRQEALSHTRAAKQWPGGSSAVSARNLVFLPPEYAELWESGVLDKTRLVAIANRNLKPAAYQELADLVRTRRREDVDERLLRMPAQYLQAGRRGPDQALEAADRHGWPERYQTVEVAEELVDEAGADGAQEEADDGAAEQATRQLRAGLAGARVAPEVQEALRQSPDPGTLVERFLTAHRKSGDPDPEEVAKTLFFAHAGPIQKLPADDKLLLRHFRPVKTQKRGQLFYRLLEVLEETILERSHLAERAERGVAEEEAMAAVRQELEDLNKDPNRYLVIPDDWLGEVTRRHLYFGSRTRKDGAAFKWFRKIGDRYYMGSHKTEEELEEKAARGAASG